MLSERLKLAFDISFCRFIFVISDEQVTFADT